jgi:hypothetical protein
MPGVLTLEGLVQAVILLGGQTFSRGGSVVPWRKWTGSGSNGPYFPRPAEILCPADGPGGDRWKFKGRATVRPETSGRGQPDCVCDLPRRGF